MGGGQFHNDVSSARAATRAPVRRVSQQTFKHSDSGVLKVHPDLNIYSRTEAKRLREARDLEDKPKATPIVVAMDVTASRGDDAKKIYARVPKLLGAIQVHDLVPDPQVAWFGVGDAVADLVPMQMSQFEADRRIDQHLEKLIISEAGGGGTGEESYELMAYYLARHAQLDIVEKGRGKGFLFITGDEAPYPQVSKDQVKRLIGGSIPEDIPTEDIFAELQQKFHTFLIYPGSSMESRREAISAEIKKRLDQAGGKYKEVSIRASLIWQDRNDLDLHCITPKGREIYYGNKQVGSGALDVDRNVRGETTKPVENIRWPKDKAPQGRYRFFVRNYAYHETKRGKVPFTVEIDIEGDRQTFEGEIDAGKTGSASDVVAFEFDYVPGQGTGVKPADPYAAYADDVILGKWQRYIPDTNIIRVKKPELATECMLGLLALQSGSMDLSDFVSDMEDRGVGARDRTQVEKSLVAYAQRGISATVDADVFA